MAHNSYIYKWQTNSKLYVIYRMVPFLKTLNDPCPRFQGHAIIWCCISQKRCEIHSFNGIL